MADMPQPGDAAPTFTGTDQNGATVRLNDYAGQPIALYFYPKDDTPGCTKQACNLRDNEAALAAEGIRVIGVSADSVESHGAFAEKYNLPFPLIADPDHDVIEAYGVWGEKNFYGTKSMGLKRTTFLIGADGTVLHVFKRPKTGDHAAEILRKYEAATA